MWVEREGIDFEGDAPRIYRTRGDSGRAKLCVFCGQCGTRLYHESEGSGVLSVKAGSLDDTTDLVPTSHLWVKRAQPWMRPLIASSCCFESEPDDDDTLAGQWRNANSPHDAR